MTLSAKLRSPAEWLAAMLFSERKRSRRLVNCVIFLFLLLPVLFIGTFSYLQSYRDLTSNIFSRRQTLAYLTATTFKEKLDHVKDIGASFATRVRFRQLVSKGKWEDAAEIMRDVPKDFPFIERIFLADPGATLRADVPALPGVRGRNFADRDWYRGGIEVLKNVRREHGKLPVLVLSMHPEDQFGLRVRMGFQPPPPAQAPSG